MCLRPAGQDHGTHDHPVELAPADDAFLYVLVVIDAPQQQMESHVIKKPATAATVTRPEARYADQTLDSSLLHRSDEHLGRLREKPRRLEDDFGPGRNTKGLDDGIDTGQRAFHRSHLKRVAGNFFEFGVTNTYSLGRPRQGTNRMSRFEGGLQGVKANPSAGADDQNCRHARQCSCRTRHSSSCVMCGLGNRTARWTRGSTTPRRLTNFGHPTLVVRPDTSRSCHRVGCTNPHPTTSSDVCFSDLADNALMATNVRFWG